MITVALWVVLVCFGIGVLNTLLQAVSASTIEKRLGALIAAPITVWIVYCLIRVLFYDGYTP